MPPTGLWNARSWTVHRAAGSRQNESQKQCQETHLCFQCQQAICQETKGRLHQPGRCFWTWKLLLCLFLLRVRGKGRCRSILKPHSWEVLGGKAVWEKESCHSSPTLPYTHTDQHHLTSSRASVSNPLSLHKNARQNGSQMNAPRPEVELRMLKVPKCSTQFKGGRPSTRVYKLQPCLGLFFF